MDYAVELVLMKRIEGGYAFIHRLLLEHFAALEPTNSVAISLPILDWINLAELALIGEIIPPHNPRKMIGRSSEARLEEAKYEVARSARDFMELCVINGDAVTGLLPGLTADGNPLRRATYAALIHIGKGNPLAVASQMASLIKSGNPVLRAHLAVILCELWEKTIISSTEPVATQVAATLRDAYYDPQNSEEVGIVVDNRTYPSVSAAIQQTLTSKRLRIGELDL